MGTLGQWAWDTRCMGGAMEENRARVWRQLAGLSSLGITFGASIAIGAAIGIGLDRWLGTSPWLTILFFLFGVAAGFTNLLKDLRRWGQ